MDDAIATLLEVQDCDLRVFNLRRQIEGVPREKAAARATLSDSDAAFELARHRVVDCEKAIKHCELDVEEFKRKIQDLQQKSLAVKKNDEYRALMKEVEKCRKKISAIEDLELERMDELEQARAARAAKQKDLDAAKRRVEATIQDLETREKNCCGQISQVEAERAEKAAGVQEDLLRLYQRMVDRGRQAGQFRLGVVPVQNGTCGGCNLAITPHVRNQVRKDQLVTCENCGCILYGE